MVGRSFVRSFVPSSTWSILYLGAHRPSPAARRPSPAGHAERHALTLASPQATAPDRLTLLHVLSSKLLTTLDPLTPPLGTHHQPPRPPRPLRSAHSCSPRPSLTLTVVRLRFHLRLYHPSSIKPSTASPSWGAAASHPPLDQRIRHRRLSSASFFSLARLSQTLNPALLTLLPRAAVYLGPRQYLLAPPRRATLKAQLVPVLGVLRR